MTPILAQTHMDRYPELSLALMDMKMQSELYKPSAFWEEASLHIASELCLLGMESFRSMPMALAFFVPTYGVPGNSFLVEQVAELLDLVRRKYSSSKKPELALDQFLNGQLSALSDYRVLLASDAPHKLPHLHNFSESAVGAPVERLEFEDRHFSRSSLNYLLGLAMLKKHLSDDDVPRTVVEIGGGFGTLGEVLSSSGINDLRYIDIDIPPISFVAQHYLCEVLGKENVGTYAQTRTQSSIEVTSLPQASVLCSWQIERLQGKVDLFINFISFQEMEPHIVKNYLSHVSRLGTRWILLRNMREGKQIRSDESSVGVETPIKSDDYLAMLPQYELMDRNVLPFGYRTVDGYHSELLLLRRKK